MRKADDSPHKDSRSLQLLGSQPNDREQLWLLLLQTFNVQPSDLTKELFLRPQDDVVRRFDAAYDKALRERIEPAESLRYDVMQPLRSYVMKNYRIVGEFDANVLFQRK